MPSVSNFSTTEYISKSTEHIKKDAFDLNCSAYYSRLLLARKDLATKGQE